MANVISIKDDYSHRTNVNRAEERAAKQAEREVQSGDLDPALYESRVIDLTDEFYKEAVFHYASSAQGRQTLPTVATQSEPSLVYRVKKDMSAETALSILTENPTKFNSVLDSKEVPYVDKLSISDGWYKTPLEAIRSMSKVAEPVKTETQSVGMTADEIYTKMEETGITADDIKDSLGMHHKTVEKLINKGTDDAEIVFKLASLFSG